MTGGAALELICPKWNKPVAEATCNICKDQCDNSIADPDNFIAKKLIVDLEKVTGNRLKLYLFNKPKVDLSDEKAEPEPAETTKPTPASGPTHPSTSTPASESTHPSHPSSASESEPGPKSDDDLLEEEMNNMDFLKDEIEETFKDRADMIIDSLGLGHMKSKDDDEDKEKDET